MNKANVDAIAGLLRQLKATDLGPLDPECHFAARQLTAWGVLVPSALTDEQAVSCNRGHPWIERSPDAAELARFVRLRLEDIAKGET